MGICLDNTTRYGIYGQRPSHYRTFPDCSDCSSRRRTDMRIISVTNQKGGCGKTTTAVNLSAVLGAQGRRVLLIDLDPQAHATIGLGLSPADCPATMYEVLHGMLPIHEAIRQNHFPGLDVIPSSIPLAAAEQFLSGLPGRERRLLESLQRIPKRNDYVGVASRP